MRYTALLPEDPRPYDNAPVPDSAWWSVAASAPEPVDVAFTVGAQAVLEYWAEEKNDRGRAPGPRVDALADGDVVEHDRFGIGTVIAVEGEGLHAVARVAFGAQKNLKRIQLRYAPMRKIGI
jgi:hypothetical protein